MRFEAAPGVPRPFLRLLPPRWTRSPPRAQLSFLYEGHEVEASSPQRGLYEPAERRFLLRDRDAEARGEARLRELGARPDVDPYASGPPGLQIAANRIPSAVAALLAEGWAVEAEGRLYRSAGRFKMSVSSGVDWFDLDGEADFEGQSVPLPRILEAIRKGARYITLGDGTLGVLPEEWTKTFAPIARLGTAEGASVRFRSVQAVLLDAWLADESMDFASTSCDEAFERARRRLADFEGIAPAEAPPGIPGRATRIPARRTRLAPLPARVRLRRLPRRRHGARQDGAGARAARIRRSVARRKAPARRSSSCRGRWCSTGSPRRPTSRRSCACSTTRATTAAIADAAGGGVRGVRPGAHDLRHAAPRRRGAVGEVEFDYADPRRGAGDQERGQLGRGQGGAAAARPTIAWR